MKQTCGLGYEKLLVIIRENYAFSSIPTEEVEALLKFMIEWDYLESFGGEIILGVKGENIANHRSFYSVFRSEPALKVMFQNRCIAEVPFSFQLQPGRGVFLAGKAWRIKEILNKEKKIDVTPAKDGESLIFPGDYSYVNPAVRVKMLEILTTGYLPSPTVFSESCIEEIEALQNQFGSFGIKNPAIERPVIAAGNNTLFFTFSGTCVNKTLDILIRDLYGDNYSYDEKRSCFELPICDREVLEIPGKLKQRLTGFEGLLDRHMKNDESPFVFSKWGTYLPSSFKKRLLLNKEFDMPGAAEFLDSVVIKTLSERHKEE